MKSKGTVKPIVYDKTEDAGFFIDTLPTEEAEHEKVEGEIVTEGVVIANMLNIRSGPSIQYVPVGTLYSGDKVEYTAENDEWLKLTNDRGFVMKKFIK